MGKGVFQRLRSRMPGFVRDSGGAAAAELVLWISLMVVPILSVIDIGLYAFQRMQVELGAQAGIQARVSAVASSRHYFVPSMGASAA